MFSLAGLPACLARAIAGQAGRFDSGSGYQVIYWKRNIRFQL